MKKILILIVLFISPVLVNASSIGMPLVYENSTSISIGATVDPNVDYESICSNNNIKSAFKTIGYVIQIVRWIVPLMLIVLGMIDFGKAAIASDDTALSKASSTLIRRFVAGLVVFFIPTIVMAILNALEITNGIEDETDTQFGACTKCLFDPFNSCNTGGSSSTTSDVEDTTE